MSSSNNTKKQGSEGKGKKSKRNNNMNTKTRDQLTKMNIPTRQRLGSERSDAGEDGCQVCMNKIEVWSVGECNHVICHVCSTRMRVLCQRNECAICRQDLPKVIFTLAHMKFEDVKDNIYPMDRKFKICFETEEIQNLYTELLDHKCPVCKEKVTFKTFKQLDQHIRREHEMYYCDLCVTNLRVFTHERKFYNRKDLVEHRRKGDPDDTSFKGHPLCEFCDERFVDDEELFKHLRKDHYFCHFCDADGFQYFYSEYPDLRNHFAKDHFLCSEPECEEQKFVVFRTEIDLKGHRLDRHGGQLSKQGAKEARKVELEFSYNRQRDDDRGGGRGRDRGGGGRGRDRYDRDRHRQDREETSQLVDQLDGPVRSGETSEHVPDMVSDFPTLSGALAKPKSGPSTTSSGGASGQSWSGRSGAAAANVEEEFPSLPGSKPAAFAPVQPVRMNKKPSPQPAQPAKSNKPKTEDFPSLSAPSRSMPAAVSKPVGASYKPQPVIKTTTTSQPSQPQTKKQQSKKKPVSFDSDEDDYPSLSGPSISLNNFSMKTVKNSGQDLSYSAAQVTSNIKTIDKSALEAPKANNSSGKVSVNSAFEFPDLGRPQQTLDLSLASASKKSKKNKNSNKNNNDSSYANKSKEKTDDKSSLNNICDFLGGGAAVKVVESKKVKKEPEVKPIVSKPAEEEIFRPSKVKPSNNNNEPPKSKKIEETASEDFPTLGMSAKKLSRNFVSAEDKLVQQKSVFNQWGKNINQIETELQRTSLSGKTSPSKKPPGFEKRKVGQYKAPSDFQQRNVALISTITNLIGGKSLEFKTFKDISGKFRAGQMSSDVYYVECKQLLDQTQFNHVFPELLTLLPDINKQQQLYELYKQDAWFKDDLLRECDNCLQINMKKDHVSHTSDHSFPSL